MEDLFDQTTIDGMTLRNRLVRSASWERMCQQDGRPTEKLNNWYRDLARGTGLIISGYTYVRPEGQQLPCKMGIYTDDFERNFESLTSTVHDTGGQADAKAIGRQPLAPSAVQVDQFPEMPSELTKDEIADIVRAFAEGARRAKTWGFDAVQLHGAYGYLINQFLSPLTNRRTDEYGGDVDNRCRFLIEKKMREKAAKMKDAVEDN
ncbi:MAG: hypothetical protein GY846_18215 [Deltaproteobacteria bacterium]|nr:hypothetical protein [Deltaproteobacteria bacterium]